MFGGFGPIIVGIVFAILGATIEDFYIDAWQILLAIVSTYVLAFVQAGSSVFNQVEGWPIAKSLAIHFACLYVVYVACYLVNRWIPFAWEVIAIFTGIFIAAYLVVWLTVYLIVRNVSKKLNKNIG